ncbi:putative molibdopterin-dependent oxidoreductase YjgC [Deinococcus metalli]|uniref:(2Fe-2S)-binding protein n=1 Tax=Deinococcus metalli TaxID=1141878 RepID=A0A7W8KCF0_9DEIO|nr:(2Fe-2S)-binding protein [Deinococcus metalli]MBB5375551.1 putative molibdopterin-dependent oxidoreductase YjgC [Deinococcus metalli]GHF28430.1 (2Fe-2S)-binding protein [Deinococcus metalli]
MPELWIEGRAVTVPDGTSVLAALQNAGYRTLRRSLAGEPRGALCGMGVCQECRAVIDGRTVRTCQTPVEAGQRVTLVPGGSHDR